MKITKAVLLAAGRGTRMRDLTADVPKPMIKVHGKPILLRIVEGLQSAGIKDFLIIIGYHGDMVREYFGDGTCFGLRISYAIQTVQDGTGRVVELAREFVGADPFILHYGDILVDPKNYITTIAARRIRVDGRNPRPGPVWQKNSSYRTRRPMGGCPRSRNSRAIERIVAAAVSAAEGRISAARDGGSYNCLRYLSHSERSEGPHTR